MCSFFFFFFFARPTDPPSREGGRWETKHFMILWGWPKPIESRPFSDPAWFDWHFAPCNGIQASLGFWIPCHGFRTPATGFQSLVGFLVGFRILWAVFSIPKPRIPDSTAKIARIPESGFLYMGWEIIVDATSGTYNALRASPPAKWQNRCCCLPHICIALHLTDEHSLLLKSELFLSLIRLDLNLLRCQEQRYLLSSQCWVQGFHLQCS